MYEKGIGTGSADCISTFFQLIESFFIRGGVPVFNLPIGSFNCLIFFDKISDDLSPILPAAILSLPI